MGQIVSLIVWFFGVAMSLAAAAWWLNTIVIGLALRWAEWHRPLHTGPLWACRLVLFGLWGLFAALTVLFICVLYRLLHALLAGWLGSVLSPSLVTAGYWVVLFAIGLAIVVGVVAGLSKVIEAWGAAQRRRFHRPEQPATAAGRSSCPCRSRSVDRHSLRRHIRSARRQTGRGVDRHQYLEAVQCAVQ
jgi:hypothetical protein